ncbi:MAG: recd3 [Chlamydiales bacterium]|jgi:exodeoxyribonuclease V alpha subunit|nr:recd3 [Chlamydiales bacterium]
MAFLGRAEKLLLETSGQRLFVEEGAAQPLESYLSSLVEKGAINSLDFSSAKRLIGAGNESALFFLTFLIAASRQGHLAVHISGDQVFPSPLEIWALEEESGSGIRERILLGATSFAEGQGPVCRWKHCYYLKRHYSDETTFLSLLRSFEEERPSLEYSQEAAQKELEAMHASGQLLAEQRLAIENAFSRRLSFIMGGPGTGKTYTAGLFIKIFLSSLSLEELSETRIALAAPTGKAAKNLEDSIKRWVNLSPAEPLQGKTLHALLAINPHLPTSMQRERILPYDLILVDECSMIDLKVFSLLLKQIKTGARLVLIGDPYQLPPVEIGGVFGDLVSSEHSFAEGKVVALKKCLRAELDAIVSLAAAINALDVESALTALETKEGLKKIELVKEDSPHLVRKQIVRAALPSFPVLSPYDPPSRLLAAFSSFRLLSPLRKGPLGVDALNQDFAEHFLKGQRHFVAPIMIARNDKTLNLANGDVGVLVKKGEGREDFFALFAQPGGERLIPAALLPHYEYAYCLSVHKSQGSEFDEVLIALPHGSEVFGREVFYTAVTRAKKKVSVLSTNEVIKRTILHSSKRLSGIKYRL